MRSSRTEYAGSLQLRRSEAVVNMKASEWYKNTLCSHATFFLISYRPPVSPRQHSAGHFTSTYAFYYLSSSQKRGFGSSSLLSDWETASIYSSGNITASESTSLTATGNPRTTQYCRGRDRRTIPRIRENSSTSPTLDMDDRAGHRPVRPLSFCLLSSELDGKHCQAFSNGCRR